MENEALDLDPTYLPALISSNNELDIVLHSQNNKFTTTILNKCSGK